MCRRRTEGATVNLRQIGLVGFVDRQRRRQEVPAIQYAIVQGAERDFQEPWMRLGVCAVQRRVEHQIKSEIDQNEEQDAVTDVAETTAR